MGFIRLSCTSHCVHTVPPFEIYKRQVAPSCPKQITGEPFENLVISSLDVSWSEVIGYQGRSFGRLRAPDRPKISSQSEVPDNFIRHQPNSKCSDSSCLAREIGKRETALARPPTPPTGFVVCLKPRSGQMTTRTWRRPSQGRNESPNLDAPPQCTKYSCRSRPGHPLPPNWCAAWNVVMRAIFSLFTCYV